MRVPVSWLREFVDIDLSIPELANLLTIAGLEVEYIKYIGIPGGYDKDRLIWDDEKLVIGQVLRVEQHPNADRLVLATVEYGAEEPEVVVTGAPNLQPFLGQGDLTEQGIYSALALEGAQLYDGYKEGLVKTKLKGRALRGIHNRCMLCSEKELGISEANDGIILMQEGVPGTPLSQVLGDAIFDIDIIPNIARCASILGVAREIASLTGKELRLPDTQVERTGDSIEGKVVIRTEDAAYNPRFTATLVEGVSQKPSPEWMQRRLRLVGQRSINVVVDISNYVMLEVGQPNHTFDYDVLRQRADQYASSEAPIELITRFPKEGETLKTLDGTEHQLKPFNVLVTDPTGVLSLGGIMGGADSEISDSTTNVLLESASWDFMNIRRSATALKINTDAGFRFSRGVHPSQAELGAHRAAKLLQTLAGGTVSSDMVDAIHVPMETPTWTLTPKDVLRISGLELSAEKIQKLLEQLDFTVQREEDVLHVQSPDHRLDIAGKPDLVEEVCRAYGYDNIPTKEMADPLPAQRTNTPLLQEFHIKDTLVRLNFQETIAYRLTSPEREDRLIPGKEREEEDRSGYIALKNPLSVDKTVMRQSVLASVLEMVSSNSKFQKSMALFEWGKGYFPGEEGGMPSERRSLAIAMSGPRENAHWQNADAPAALDFFDLKGALDALLEACHIQQWHVQAAEHPTFRPGRTAELFVNKESIGIFGEIHPLVVETFDMRTTDPVLAAELDLERLLPHLQPAFKVQAVSPFPAVQEDLALLVDKSLSASDVEAAIRKIGGFLLKNIELFDVYEGKQVPEGKRSLAYHLTFQSPSKTLTDKEVGKNRAKLIKQLEKQLGATLR